ncbi:hypothetical protein MTDSW087_04998 [Methylobacterium dankookense]|uniref:Uncharacterized protein n=1 Tax=Methylobacterium dankookense TaxID=560405 RepID=A0A564G5B3_9HYPH|nr:hypothetical protein IFDJLNFL_4848 [Methylobacterium dankookense]VUF15262.1 hypothetical protein MTDSW087_04998 [Methylobacterium dankookense]
MQRAAGIGSVQRAAVASRAPPRVGRLSGREATASARAGPEPRFPMTENRPSSAAQVTASGRAGSHFVTHEWLISAAFEGRDPAHWNSQPLRDVHAALHQIQARNPVRGSRLGLRRAGHPWRLGLGRHTTQHRRSGDELAAVGRRHQPPQHRDPRQPGQALPLRRGLPDSPSPCREQEGPGGRPGRHRASGQDLREPHRLDRGARHLPALRESLGRVPEGGARHRRQHGGRAPGRGARPPDQT